MLKLPNGCSLSRVADSLQHQNNTYTKSGK